MYVQIRTSTGDERDIRGRATATTNVWFAYGGWNWWPSALAEEYDLFYSVCYVLPPVWVANRSEQSVCEAERLESRNTCEGEDIPAHHGNRAIKKTPRREARGMG